MTESWQRNWRAVKLRCLTWKEKNQQPNSFQNEVFLVWKKCGTTLEANMHDKLLEARKIILLSCRNDAPKNSNLPRSIWQPCFSFCVGNFTPVQTDLLWLEFYPPDALHSRLIPNIPRRGIRRLERPKYKPQTAVLWNQEWCILSPLISLPPKGMHGRSVNKGHRSWSHGKRSTIGMAQDEFRCQCQQQEKQQTRLLGCARWAKKIAAASLQQVTYIALEWCHKLIHQ
jgi:hypothetical protein